ncbi:MAG: ABC transporter permease [Acidobacteriota bacterium]
MSRALYRPVLLFAGQELVIAMRSRWTQIFAVTFAALALAVAVSGYVLSGGHGVQDFARTAASLIQMVLLLVPATALFLGVLALAPERGATELVYAQPVPRSAVLVGKALGLTAALAAAQAIGFGAAGVVVFARAGGEGVIGYLILVAASMVLTAVFVSLAAFIAAASPGRRARSLAVAMVAWFLAVVLYDVAALGAASVLPSRTASRLLIISVLLNPVDAVRTGALLATQGTTAFGAASLAFFRFTGGTVGAALLLALSLVVWLVGPMAAAARRLERCDL